MDKPGSLYVDVRKRILTANGWLTLEVRWDGEPGSLTAVFGPSGAGKTTFLRMVAGLTAPDDGIIRCGGEIWFDSRRGVNRPVQRRGLGYVFQEYSLFPHMSVRENIAYGVSGGGVRDMVEGCLQMTGLGALSDRYPAQLSGGQQQRVALARALVRQPKVLLLDEPLSALDPVMRGQLQDEVLGLQRRLGVTTLMVSHDAGEVSRMASQVIVLKDGAVQQIGAPDEIFSGWTNSRKFKFMAEVVSVVKDGFVAVFTLRVGQSLVTVVDADDECASLQSGDRVFVSSKAFAPVITKCAF